MVPQARALARQAAIQAQKQFHQEFSSETDTGTFVVALFDISADSFTARARIADEFNSIMRTFVPQPARSLYRYANQVEEIGGGSGSETRTAVRDKFVDSPIPSVPNTMLAQALGAAERNFVRHRLAYPNSRLILLIGSNGGVEDIAASQKVSQRLQKLGVTCVYYGAEARITTAQDAPKAGVQSRVIENTRLALSALDRANQLQVLTKNDFGSRLPFVAKSWKSQTP